MSTIEKILKQARLAIRIFTQNILIANLLVNATFVYSIYINRSSESFSLFYLFIGRLFISTFLIYILWSRMKNEFIYYSNIGLPKRELLAWQFAIDAALSLIILVAGYGVIR